MSENDGKHKGGEYKAFQKLHLMHEIERLLKLGYSASYIQKQLGLGERTYNRYRKQAFQDEKAALLGLNVDHVMEKILASEVEFKEIKEKLIELSTDKSMDGSSRVLALQTAVETIRQSLTLYVDLPDYINRLSGSPQAIQATLNRLERKREKNKLLEEEQVNLLINKP